MGYGSSTWNASVEAKAKDLGQFVGYDDAGFAHRSKSKSGLTSIINAYNNASVAINNSLNNSVFNSAQTIVDANNDRYQQYYDTSNAYNSAEAQKNRDFQKEMSDTAHQREVQDLQKAGLNPILSVNSGASTPSGSTASSATGNVDSSLAGVYASIYNTLVNSSTALKQTKMSTDASKLIASINANSAQRVAQTGAYASMYGADQSYKTAHDTSPLGITMDVLDSLGITPEKIGSLVNGYFEDRERKQKSKEQFNKILHPFQNKKSTHGGRGGKF